MSALIFSVIRVGLTILGIASHLAYAKEISQLWSWTPDRSSFAGCAKKQYTIPLHLISYLSAVDPSVEWHTVYSGLRTDAVTWRISHV